MQAETTFIPTVDLLTKRIVPVQLLLRCVAVAVRALNRLCSAAFFSYDRALSIGLKLLCCRALPPYGTVVTIELYASSYSMNRAKQRTTPLGVCFILVHLHCSPVTERHCCTYLAQLYTSTAVALLILCVYVWYGHKQCEVRSWLFNVKLDLFTEEEELRARTTQR